MYRYEPKCSTPGCGEPARYKVAAPWSDGTSRELKNYGLACEGHRASQLERARRDRRNFSTAPGETVGPIGLYQLIPGKRDGQLPRLPDDDG